MLKSLRLGSVFALAIAMIATAFTATHVEAASPPKAGAVGGVVLAGERGSAAPVADAGVQLVLGDKVIARTKTDAKGQFRFVDIRPGAYIVRAAKQEVGAGRDAAPVRPGSVVRTRIVLKKP